MNYDDDQTDDPTTLLGCGGLMGCGVGAALLALGIVALVGLLIWSGIAGGNADTHTAVTEGLTLSGPEGDIEPGLVPFDGMADHDAEVNLLLNDTVVGTAVADAEGHWQLETVIEEPGHYTAVALVDDHGEEKRSNTLDFNVMDGDGHDDMALTAPTLALPDGDIDLNAVALTGTAAPNTTVIVYRNGDMAGETDADADGQWAFTTAVDTYRNEFEAVGQTEDGEEYGRSDAALLLVAAAARPLAFTAAPSLGEPTFDGELPRVPLSWSGTAEPATTLQFFADDQPIGTRDVDADGSWAFDTELQLEPGDYALSAKMLDADANLLAEAEPVALTIPEFNLPDTDLPAADLDFDFNLNPADFNFDGDLPKAGLALSGIALPNAVIEFFAGDVSLGTTTADADGNWQFDGDLALEPGNYDFVARMSDADGNALGESAAFPFTIPAAAAAAADGDEGEAASSVSIDAAEGGELAYEAVTLTGTAVPDTDVTLTIDSIDVAKLATDGDGSFSYTGYYAPGDHTAVATIDDAASEPFDFVVGTAGAPPALADTDMGGVTVLFTAPDSTAVDTADADGLEPLAGSPAVELILDASWSMTLDTSGDNRLTAVDPNSRIAIAKEALDDLIADSLPEGMPIAVRAFGNIEGNLACRTDLMLPLQALNRDELTAVVDNINPQFDANTAIAAALAQVGSDLAETERPKIVVLLTDGEETCGGDPAAEIAALREQEDIQVNVIGFAIADDELKGEFERWAELGGGSYYDAQDANQLVTALGNTLTVRYNVIDASGETVATGVVGGGPVTIPAGAYTLELIGADGIAYEHVVVTPGGLVQLVGRPVEN